MEENNEIKSVEELKDELVHKLDKEMYEYKQELLQLSPEEIIENSYKLTVKQEILEYLTYDKYFTRPELESLLASENILEQGYDEWLDFDGNLRESLEYPTDNLVDTITEEKNKEKSLNDKNKDAR